MTHVFDAIRRNAEVGLLGASTGTILAYLGSILFGFHFANTTAQIVVAAGFAFVFMLIRRRF